MNHKDAAYIILNTKRILDAANVLFIPMYGTLLGMIRENGFIKGDHDMDIMVFAKDLQNLIDLIPEFDKIDIKFTRCSEPWVYTFIYRGAECDFYVIQPAKWPYSYRYCKVCDKYMLQKYFELTEKYTFLGTEFDIPKNPVDVLEYCYGKDWRVPMYGKAGRAQSKLLIHISLYQFLLRCISYIRRRYLGKE